MKLAPDAQPDDGWLDVLTVSGVGRVALLNLLATKVRKGEHVHHAAVDVHKAKKVEITPQEPSPLLVDGDLVGATPVRMSLHPGILKIYA